LDQVVAARRVSVPLVAVTTADQPAVEQRLLPRLANGSAGSPANAVFVWDLADGLRPLNEPAVAAVPTVLGDLDQPATQDPVLAFRALVRLPARGAVFARNAHRVLDHPATVQAVANLRDRFKENGRMLLLLAPALRLPVELEHDVLVLDEPLPDAAQLRQIVADQYAAAELAAPSAETLDAAAAALRALSAFAAEQAVALSLTRQGVRVDALWTRKVQMIDQTPGLSVWAGAERFDTLGGLDQVKTLLRRILAGRQAPQAIVFLDEIEKALAGATGPVGDSSGVAQDMLGCLLSHMQDRGAVGMIFVGPPGTAKSAVAKAAGNEAGVPTLRLDLGATKGSLVGESEARIRQALKIIDAVSDGRSLWIATCNKVAVLPPELRRRFKFGTIFFDLPDDAERAAIWRVYRRKYEIPADDPTPADAGWTGAEIETCCQLAWQLRISLTDAARYVVPVSQAAPEAIDDLRRQAAGRYLSASRPGVYQLPSATPSVPGERKRQLALD
jgi:DNA-binding transcriptional regulator YdaS (Cro superfamily)